MTPAPEGECIHIRQCTSAYAATNMLHFQYSIICHNMFTNAALEILNGLIVGMNFN